MIREKEGDPTGRTGKISLAQSSTTPTVPEIDNNKIVHFGYSLGGYLVARYAAHDSQNSAKSCR